MANDQREKDQQEPNYKEINKDEPFNDSWELEGMEGQLDQWSEEKPNPDAKYSTEEDRKLDEMIFDWNDHAQKGIPLKDIPSPQKTEIPEADKKEPINDPELSDPLSFEHWDEVAKDNEMQKQPQKDQQATNQESSVEELSDEKRKRLLMLEMQRIEQFEQQQNQDQEIDPLAYKTKEEQQQGDKNSDIQFNDKTGANEINQRWDDFEKKQNQYDKQFDQELDPEKRNKLEREQMDHQDKMLADSYDRCASLELDQSKKADFQQMAQMHKDNLEDRNKEDLEAQKQHEKSSSKSNEVNSDMEYGSPRLQWGVPQQRFPLTA